MSVAFSAHAEAELERIGDFIARDNPLRARSFLRELHASCMAIGAMPDAFPLVPRHEQAGIRRRVHGNYLIFYRVAGARVEILHILHGAMDVERLLFPGA